MHGDREIVLGPSGSSSARPTKLTALNSWEPACRNWPSLMAATFMVSSYLPAAGASMVDSVQLAASCCGNVVPAVKSEEVACYPGAGRASCGHEDVFRSILHGYRHSVVTAMSWIAPTSNPPSFHFGQSPASGVFIDPFSALAHRGSCRHPSMAGHGGRRRRPRLIPAK